MSAVLRVLLPVEQPDRSIEEVEVLLPARWEICHVCAGHGASSAHIGAITAQQWHDEWDQDEQDAYLRGQYDRPCVPCGGSGKVLEFDDHVALTDLQRQALEYRDHIAQEDALERSIIRAELRLAGDC